MWILIPFVISLLGTVISCALMNIPLVVIFGCGIVASAISGLYPWKAKESDNGFLNGPKGCQLYSWKRDKWENLGWRHFFEFSTWFIPFWGIVIGPAIIMM